MRYIVGSEAWLLVGITTGDKGCGGAAGGGGGAVVVLVGNG